MSHPSPEVVREDDLPIPFGRFTLTRVVGKGGMGRVFAAVLTGPSGFRKDVALKVISGGDRERLDEVRRGLGDEARIGALLRHPNIVDVYDFGEDDGLPWISMEMVHGVDLQAVMDRTRLAPVHVIQVGMAIAAGLEHAHTLQINDEPAGLVHRDLKPSNVLLSRDGVVKVMDFGIAKLTSEGHHTATGVAKGTPAYMAPEQAAAEELDGRADLWSLGAILFQLATGEPLLQGRTIIELMMQLLQLPQRLANPAALMAVEEGVPGLAPVVQRLLQQDPKDRYSTAAEVETALAELVPGLPSAPSLRAFVRDLLTGGDGLALPNLTTRPLMERLGLSATMERVTPTNIAPDPSSFHGRASDLEQLSAMFAQGRLVTLLGSGGTGKTRLAREFALGYLPEVAQGGAWFAALDEARSLDGVLHAVGSALGVPLSKGDHQAQLDQIGASLAGRGGVLLVLDNFEQVAALGPQTVGRWLMAAPKLRVLVTSRELLRIEGEDVLALGPLDEEAAVKLFVDRAQASRARFAPTDADKEIIAQIVRRLDAIPLAVELAASRISVLPPAKLLDRLSQRFRLLRGGQRGTSARQATLEGAIAWSWDLLLEHEQWTLAHCAVFRGGFTLEQAEQLIDLDRFDGGPWVLDVVEALRDKSLLRSFESQSGEPRFGMFESIREFASARLDALGAASSARDRHAEVMLELGQALEDRMWGPGAVDAHNQLGEELENVSAAWAHAHASGDPVTAARLALAIEPLLRRRGPAELNQRQLKAAMDAEASLEPRLLARVVNAYATTVRLLGKSTEGLELAWRSVRLAEEAGDELLAAKMSIALGHSLRGPDGSAEVLTRMEQSLAHVRRIGDRPLEGLILSSYALAVGWAGRSKEERRLHHEALALHRESGARRMAAAEAGNIAVQYALDGDLEDAEQWMLEAYEGFKQSYDPMAIQITLGNLASLYVELARPDDADRALRRALDSAERMGIRHLAPILVTNRGLLALTRGKVEQGLRLLHDAERLYGELEPAQYHLGVLDTSIAMGNLLGRRPAAATERLKRGVSRFSDCLMPRDQGLAEGLLAVALAQTGDEPGAMAALDRARALADSLDDDDVRLVMQLGEGHVELLRASQARASGETEDAFLLQELAEARLDMTRTSAVRPTLVRLARTLLEEAVSP